MLSTRLVLAALVTSGCASAPADRVDTEPVTTEVAPTPPEKKERPGFDDLAPAIGSAAPTLALTNLDGESIDLAASFRTGPTVLIFGSYS
jgi:hypothetical protein